MNTMDNYQKEHLKELRSLSLKETSNKVKHSFHSDSHIIQASRSMEDLDKCVNSLGKRLRDWYDIYAPEFSRLEKDHEKFVRTINRQDKRDILHSINIKESIGSEIGKDDLEAIKNLSKLILEIYESKKRTQKYIEISMAKTCPNIKAVAGPLLGAKLLAMSGSLKDLAMTPASTIQVLGAEKALFRHIKDKKYAPPKHGILHEHELLQRADKDSKGKIARALSDKIAIAAKIDYFKGDFIGNKLRIQVEEKLNKRY